MSAVDISLMQKANIISRRAQLKLMNRLQNFAHSLSGGVRIELKYHYSTPSFHPHFHLQRIPTATMFLPLLTLLPLLAPTFAAPQPNTSSQCSHCKRMEGDDSDSPLSSFFDKYSTVPGFADFTSELYLAAGIYGITQTFITDEIFVTATESEVFGPIIATNTNSGSYSKEFIEAMSSYVAAETVLPTGIRDEVKSDFDAMWETGTVTTQRSLETVTETLTPVLSSLMPTVPTVLGATTVVTQTLNEVPSFTATVNAGMPRLDMLSVLGLLVGMVVAVVGAL
jgi:hypothetical protein